MDIWTAIRKMHQISCISYEDASKQAKLDRSYIRRVLANKTNLRIDVFARIVHTFGFELYLSDGNQSIAVRSTRVADKDLKAVWAANAFSYIEHHTKVGAKDISLAVHRSEDWFEKTAAYGGRPSSPVFFDVVAAAQMHSFIKGYGTTIYLVGNQSDRIDSNDNEPPSSLDKNSEAGGNPATSDVRQTHDNPSRTKPTPHVESGQSTNSQWAHLRERNAISKLPKKPPKQSQSEDRRNLAIYAARILANILHGDSNELHSLTSTSLAFNMSYMNAVDCYRRIVKTSMPLHLDKSSIQLYFSEDLSPSAIAERINIISSNAQYVNNKWGINALCLSLGTLHWTDNRDAEHNDPLLLVQIRLVENASDDGYTVYPCSNFAFTNPLLELRLSHQANIKLPRFNAKDDVKPYFEQVNQTDNPRGFCNATPEAGLCVVPFQNALAYQDVVSHSNELLTNPLVHMAVNHQGKATTPSVAHVPTNKAIDLPCLIANADLYQQRAIAAASNGQSFILEGGPGTGKSQTAANIIADRLCAGKSVLYITERPTLISDMQKRFQRASLHRFFLPLLDDNEHVDGLRAELQRTLNDTTEPSYSRTSGMLLDEWQQAYSKIDEYASQLTEPLQPLGKSPYEAMGILWQYQQRHVKTLDCEMPFVESIDEEGLEKRRKLVNQYARTQDSAASSAPQHVVPHGDWSSLGVSWNVLGADQSAIEALESVASSAQRLLALHANLRDELEVIVDRTWEGMQGVLETIELDSNGATSNVLPNVPSIIAQQTELEPDVETLREVVAQNIQALSSLDPSFKISPDLNSPIDIEEVARIRTAVTDLLSARHYEAWKTMPDNVVDNAIVPLRSQVERVRELRGIVLKDYQEDILQIDQDEVERLLKADRRSTLERFFGHRTQGPQVVARYRRTIGTVTQDESLLVLDRLREIARTEQVVNEFGALYASVLPGLYRGVSSNIENIVRLRNAFGIACRLPKFLNELEHSLEIHHAEAARVANQRLNDLSTQIRDVLSQSEQAFSTLSAAASGRNLGAMDLDELQRAATDMQGVVAEHQASEEKASLAREQCFQQGLDSFIDAIDDLNPMANSDEKITYEDIFMHTFYRKWYDSVVKAARPAICELDTDRQIAIIEHLERTSGQRYLNNCHRLAATLFDRARSLRTQQNRSMQVTYLTRALANDRIPFSVRDALRLAPQAMQRLKPCIMMSPLAAASHIGSSSITFDIVVIDGASNLQTKDVLLVLGHARQAVFVSDGNRLDSSLLTDISQLETLTIENHHRSQNESLITFPNRVFYHNELRTFPSCSVSGVDDGIQVVTVDERGNGTPAAGNKEEASCVIDIAFSHFAQCGPKRSIGVIAFDKSQTETIRQELVQRRKNEPSYERCFKDTLNEPFFVVTADDAVGYERDIIILSLGYTAGRSETAAGTLTSLTTAEGTRNLVNAITRARLKTIVVTSITAEQIDSTQDVSNGVRMLHDYLVYAENPGSRSRDAGSHATASGIKENDWLVNTLQTLLTKHGYVVDTHVGTLAYKVDLAVRHPKYDGWYCLGILCDGLTYRNSVSAQEQEQTVNGVLRNRGWTLFHAWSDTWLSSPATHEQALLSSVKKAIASFRPPILGLTTSHTTMDKKCDGNQPAANENVFIPEKPSDIEQTPITKSHSTSDKPQTPKPEHMPVTRTEASSKHEPCEVEEIEITREHERTQPPPSPSLSPEQQSYLEWLYEGGVTPFTAKSYVKTVTTIENVIEEAGYPRPHLYGCSKQEIDCQANLCRKNPAFVDRDNARYHLLTRALNSFVTYAHSQNDPGNQETSDLAQSEGPELIPQHVLEQEISDLVNKRDAQALGRFGVCSVYDLTLFRREELLELPEVSNDLLSRIEYSISKECGAKFEVDGSGREVRDKRRLTRDEMLVLDKPISFLETEPVVRRLLQRNAIDTCRKVAFTTIDEFLDCPGIDLETTFMLEALIGKMLGSRVFLGRQQGEIPLVAPREAPLRHRLSEHTSDKALASDHNNLGLLDWVATLPSPAKEHVQAFLSGFEVAAMAQKERIPTSTIWNLVAHAFINRPSLREDALASLFCTYNLTLVEFCHVTQQPPSTYRYLELIHTHGQASVYPMTEDKTLPAEYRERAAACPLGAKTLPKPSLLTLELPTLGNGDRLRQSVRNSQQGARRNADSHFGTKRTLIELVNALVVNGNEYSVDYLFEAIKGNDKRIYFANQIEFESALRRAYCYDDQVSFPADGIIRFGTCDRRMQVTRLRSQLDSSDPNEIAKEYEHSYGIGANVVRYWLREIDGMSFPTTKSDSDKRAQRTTPSKPPVKNVNRNQAVAQQLEFLRSELNVDCCDRKLIVERFRARYPQGPSDPFDAVTLNRLGYKRRGKKLLFKKDIDPQAYFEKLIASHDRFSKGDSGFESAVFNDPLFRRTLRQKMRSFEIVEYDKGSYIKLESLCEAMSIEPDDLKGYSRAVAEAVGKAVPFTIWSLRNHMNLTFPLDVLATEGGVGDHLFETLLDIDPHVQTCSMGKKRCFIVTEGPITAGNVLECIMETTQGGMDFDDLRYHLKDSYDITIAELPLHHIVRRSSLYYDDITECVFNSRQEWEEMVERELVDRGDS